LGINFDRGFDTAVEILWPEIERLSKRLKGLGHNHVTRDIKEPGECPRCDNYHNARKVADLERKLAVAKEALKNINKEELNSQRPGGGYSKSARISFEALKKIEEEK
jgi:hypothetical protein